MRLLIVGSLKGQLTLATRIAMDRGAAVTNADSVDQALAVMRSRRADLVMVDVALSVHDLVQRFEAERIRAPVSRLRHRHGYACRGRRRCRRARANIFRCPHRPIRS
jgi:DNA-binding NtrC family response regulator